MKGLQGSLGVVIIFEYWCFNMSWNFVRKKQHGNEQKGRKMYVCACLAFAIMARFFLSSSFFMSALRCFSSLSNRFCCSWGVSSFFPFLLFLSFLPFLAFEDLLFLLFFAFLPRFPWHLFKKLHRSQCDVKDFRSHRSMKYAGFHRANV